MLPSLLSLWAAEPGSNCSESTATALVRSSGDAGDPVNYTKGMYAYTTVVSIAALAVAVLAAHLGVSGNWLPVGLLALVIVVAEHFAFQLPVAGSVSLSFSLAYAAMLYCGPLAGIVCALVGASSLREYRAHKPPAAMAFNTAQLVLSIGAAGLAYQALGGRVLSLGVVSLGGTLPPAAAAAVAFYVLNVLLVAGAVSVLQRARLKDAVANMGFLSYGVSLVILALLGLLLAHLLALGSWLGVLLLVLPFMATRRVFRVYVELSAAYSETVRSLMAAIEAKDPYTRGHSERVAEYARRLAESAGVSHAEADLTERAALLHDVGKIGIALDTLTSHDRLSTDELRAIKMHPLLGGEIVAEIEFLSDAVPVIRHHHERFDGAGYPDGIVGEDIPMLSRILSVADSYDAMTSDRAYRPAMSAADARAEMLRVSGTQLDGRLVERFVAMLDAEDGQGGVDDRPTNTGD